MKLRRQLWYVPSLVRTEGHRKVSWLELFYDLFFVVTISQLAHKLHGELVWLELLKYLFLFVPVWWLWIGSTFYMERFETEGLETRIIFFLLLFPISGLAVFAYDGLATTSFGFVASYTFGRFVLSLLWLRASIHEPVFRPTGIRYLIGFSTSLVLLCVSLFMTQETRLVLFAIALFIDLVTPWFTLTHQSKLPRFNRHKLPERFGLFIIIVLGESAVGVVSGLAASRQITLESGINAVLGIGLGFSLWWVYFDFIGRRASRPRMLSSISWSFLHLPLAMGIAAVGATTSNAIAKAQGLLQGPVSVLLAGSVAVTLIVMGLLETVLEPADDEPTHPVISPALKFGFGALLGMYAAMFPWSAPTLTLVLAQLALLVVMLYGLWVWFTDGHAAKHGRGDG
ncbi:MAG: low temperature requirement protein A [Ignavibacteriae bacterium]|nr:low temperature requirement protein A [Ignavibacteriota bacterium]